MNAGRIVIAAVVIAAIVILLVVSAWADDRAKPGTRGRGQVTRSAP
jgi:hypothetical protein